MELLRIPNFRKYMKYEIKLAAILVVLSMLITDVWGTDKDAASDLTLEDYPTRSQAFEWAVEKGFFSIESRLCNLVTIEKIDEWSNEAFWKCIAYLGPNPSDLLDYCQITSEAYKRMYGPRDYEEIDNIIACREIGPNGEYPDRDRLYPKVYGDYYIYTFPAALRERIGQEKFEDWFIGNGYSPPVTGDANGPYAGNLAECLDYFKISNEEFTQLVMENGLEYFFTPERLEGLYRFREIYPREVNPITGAC